MANDPLADWFRDRTTPPREGAPPETAALGDDPTPPAPPPEVWLDDDAPGPSRRLMAFAAAPWLLVVLLGAALLLGDRPAGSVQAPGPAPATPDPSPVSPPPAVPGPGAPPAPSTPPSAPAVSLGALGALHVRLALTTTDGEHNRYVDAATPERVQMFGPVAVVTVLAVVLEGEAGSWATAQPQRFAVALSPATGARLADPWPLAPPDLGLADPDWEPLADDSRTAEVHAALEQAGYRDVEDVAVARGPDGLLRADGDVTAPGQDRAESQTILLATDPVRVLGEAGS